MRKSAQAPLQRVKTKVLLRIRQRYEKLKPLTRPYFDSLNGKDEPPKLAQARSKAKTQRFHSKDTEALNPKPKPMIL
jgi:hypothetical protein